MIRNTLRLVSSVSRPASFNIAKQSSPFVSRNYGTLSEKDITDRVINIISNYDKTQGKVVTPTTTFKELGLDSLDAADILVAVEEEFGIEIPDEDADRISSTAETINYLKKTPTAK